MSLKSPDVLPSSVAVPLKESEDCSTDDTTCLPARTLPFPKTSNKRASLSQQVPSTKRTQMYESKYLPCTIAYIHPKFNTTENFQDYVAGTLQSLAECQFPLIDQFPALSVSRSEKPLLTLDLDETLVYVDLDESLSFPDTKIKFDFKGSSEEISLHIRPGLDDFIDKMSKLYDLLIFTASIKEYADAIIDYIDRKNVIKARFYRSECVKVNDLFFVKNLNGLEGDLSKVVAVDNNLYSFANNLSNCALVSSFMGDKSDRELENLANYLKFLSDKADFREVNEQIFGFEKVRKSF